RIYLSNIKQDEKQAKVRLRFADEVWDLTLEPGAEVGVELSRRFNPDSNWAAGEEPRAEVVLCMLQGKASLKKDTYFYNNLEASPGANVILWDNEGPGGQGPRPLPHVLPFWTKDLPIAEW